MGEQKKMRIQTTSGHRRLCGMVADFLAGAFLIVAFFAGAFLSAAFLAGTFWADAVFSLATLTLDA